MSGIEELRVRRTPRAIDVGDVDFCYGCDYQDYTHNDCSSCVRGVFNALLESTEFTDEHTRFRRGSRRR